MKMSLAQGVPHKGAPKGQSGEGAARKAADGPFGMTSWPYRWLILPPPLYLVLLPLLLSQNFHAHFHGHFQFAELQAPAEDINYCPFLFSYCWFQKSFNLVNQSSPPFLFS